MGIIGGLWKCVIDGSNCKVNVFVMNVDWLVVNLSFVFVLGVMDYSIVIVIKDNVNYKFMISMFFGMQYGLEI